MSEPSTSSLANLIWGEARLKRRCELLKILTTNPVFSKSGSLYSLSRRDVWTIRAQQAKELIELRLKLGWTREHFLDAIRLIGEAVPAYPQYRIFMNNLLSQMSPEQQAYWVPKADRFEIFGCYAQTELGHGSNLHGIETTATFDKDTDEFILNSPTISSTKFWSGTLGCWATHAIVVSRLIVDKKDLGNHLFLVQVRDLDTQDLLPGVSIYDHGEKAMGALGGVDNGAMRFYGCRIPRSHMFAGAASVSKDGVYTPSKNKNHSFTSMVIIRGLLSDELGLDMAKALYIAAKYAGFRRQFGATNGGQETRVIDYGSVQYRLYPSIARAVTLMVTGREIAEKVRDQQSLRDNLQSLHLETVGCKVYASEHAVRATDLARLVCGGHGTLASAGLGVIYASLSPSRTYEGDSYVISLQIGRAVAKHWGAGTYKSIPALSYLERLSKIKTSEIRLTTTGPESWFKAGVQHDFLEHRAALLAKRHLDDTARGRDTSFDVLELTMAHSDLVYWKALQTQFPRVPEENKEVMQAVIQLFALTTLVEGLNTFAGHSFITAEDVARLRLAQEQAIETFGLHVDTILDAYSFTDYETDSTLCKSGRNPYEAIMDVVRKSPLNDTQFIRPTMISARSLWKKYPSPSL